MLIVETSALGPASNAQQATGASAQIVPLNTERNGLQIKAAKANTATVFLLLGAGTASATSFHIGLEAGESWVGLISGVLWTGPVQAFSAAAQVVTIIEV